MEKVKITRKQADAINELLKEIHGMKIINLVRAIKEGYEVEPNLKDGDMLYHPYSNSIGEVKGGTVHWEDGIENELEAVKNMLQAKEVRFADSEEIAKEKERRWWAKHGREVWELKNGDVLSRNKYSASTVYNVDAEGVIFNELAVFKNWNDLKKEYKISCFAEDRKDV